MIDGLDIVLMDKDQPGAIELQAALAALMAKYATGRFLSQQKLLCSRVHRLRFDTDSGIRSFVVKRHAPSFSQLERSLVERWLPQTALAENGPPLIGCAAEKAGRCIWHIYNDLGDSSLPEYAGNPAIVREAVSLIAKVHTRFADHILLGECRMSGGNYGPNSYSSNILDAIRTLERLTKKNSDLPPACSKAVDSLLHRLTKLFDTRKECESLLAEYNGPETLVHGDLWTKNFLVESTATGRRLLLIDWDRVGVGSVTYDLSTLLLRFEEADRPAIVDWYCESIDGLNWPLPPFAILNVLLEAAEHTRLAITTTSTAVHAGGTQPEWAFDSLVEIDGWFESLKPILPVGPTAIPADEAHFPQAQRQTPSSFGTTSKPGSPRTLDEALP